MFKIGKVQRPTEKYDSFTGKKRPSSLQMWPLMTGNANTANTPPGIRYKELQSLNAWKQYLVQIQHVYKKRDKRLKNPFKLSALYRVLKQKQRQASLRLLAWLSYELVALVRSLQTYNLNLNPQFMRGKYPDVIIQFRCTTKIGYPQQRQ